MGQKDGEKWTAAIDSQPTLPKPDRLLGHVSEQRSQATRKQLHKALELQRFDCTWRSPIPVGAAPATEATMVFKCAPHAVTTAAPPAMPARAGTY